MANDILTRPVKVDFTDFFVYGAKSDGEEGRILAQNLPFTSGLWESITGITSLITSEPVKINTLITDKQSFSPVINTQIIDLLLGDSIDLDVTGVTGDLTLTLSNPKNTGAWELIVTQPLISVDIVFPSGTKTLNGSGDTVLGIGSATQRIIFDYNGTNFTILATGEVN